MKKQALVIGLCSGFGLGGIILAVVFLMRPEVVPVTSDTSSPVVDVPMDHTAHEMPEGVDDGVFLEHMIPHHEEAVATSKLMLDRVSDLEQQDFLRAIINDQTLEIDQMKAWYLEWFGAAYVDLGVYEPMMPDLEAIADDTEAWKAYLTGMIAHHEGAVEMATTLLNGQPRRELSSMAVTIIRVQNEEIGQMRAWLQE